MQSVSSVLSGLRNLVLSSSAPAVHTRLSKILEEFATTFFSELNEACQSVAQRSAGSEHIDATHNQLATTLEARAGVMKKLWDEARGLYKKVPDIDKPNEKAEALSSVMGIEMLGTHLERKTTDFIKVIKDPNFNQALEESKAAIRSLETLSTLGTIQQKVTELVEQFNKMKPKIEATKDSNLFFINDTLLLYILYAAKSFKKEIPAGSTVLTGLLLQLEADAKKLVRSYVVDLDSSNLLESTAAATDKPLLESATSTTLPSAYKFRNGTWKQWLARFPIARYSAIESQIQELEGVAKCVYKIECAFRDQIANPCKLNKATLEQLETQSGDSQMLTRAALCSLSDITIAPEIHAGFYYGFALRTQAKVLSTSIKRFEKMATSTYKDHLELVDLITKALATPEIEFSSIIMLLSKRACLKDDDIGVAALLKATIDNLVNQFSTVRATEVKMLESLYTGNLDFQAESAVIERYLAANLIGYFYGTPAQAFNPEFEVALFRLKTEYTNQLQSLVRNASGLQPLLTNYLKICEASKHVLFTVAASKALNLLATSGAANANAYIDTYCAQNPDKTHTETLIWLKEKLNKK
ncbi:MAG: hypothetical protein LLF94_07715 [Chlamydiales bacterium]|nr:hypothetical protein [Chlamydiales bacterium]